MHKIADVPCTNTHTCIYIYTYIYIHITATARLLEATGMTRSSIEYDNLRRIGKCRAPKMWVMSFRLSLVYENGRTECKLVQFYVQISNRKRTMIWWFILITAMSRCTEMNERLKFRCFCSNGSFYNLRYAHWCVMCTHHIIHIQARFYYIRDHRIMSTYIVSTMHNWCQ